MSEIKVVCGPYTFIVGDGPYVDVLKGGEDWVQVRESAPAVRRLVQLCTALQKQALDHLMNDPRSNEDVQDMYDRPPGEEQE